MIIVRAFPDAAWSESEKTINPIDGGRNFIVPVNSAVLLVVVDYKKSDVK